MLMNTKKNEAPVSISKPSDFQRELEAVAEEESKKTHPDFCSLAEVDVTPENLPMQTEIENLLNLINIMHEKNPDNAAKLRNSVKKRQPALWKALIQYLDICTDLSLIRLEANRQAFKQMQYEQQLCRDMTDEAMNRVTDKLEKELEDILDEDATMIIDAEAEVMDR